MRIKFNKTGAERKALITAMGEILSVKPKYAGMPTMNYEVDYFTITKDGTVEFNDMADSEEIENLLEALAERGFVAESSEYDEPMPDIEVEEVLEDCPPPYGVPEDTGLTISIPLEKVKVGNLTNILESKADLIKKALGVSDIRIAIDPDKVSFPWFSEMPDAEEVKAYSQFIAAICEMSVNQKRITAKAKDNENEKYAFRCFLLRLGFIGDEYKAARKILLKNLTGSSAFKNATKDYKVELDDDNFKIFSAKNDCEAQDIAFRIAEENGSEFCEVSEVTE